MRGRSKLLPVPYFMQPTAITCQSTVLKMMASYLEQYVVKKPDGALALSIPAIWSELNESKARPIKARNAHGNFKWWLETRFPQLRVEQRTLHDEIAAIEYVVASIDAAYPVLASVSHENVKGHIVLIVGYVDYLPHMSTEGQAIVVHDPYGAFDPSLGSKLWGKRRGEGGMSLVGGGESAPGRNVSLPMSSLSRHRVGDARFGNYEFLTLR